MKGFKVASVVTLFACGVSVVTAKEDTVEVQKQILDIYTEFLQIVKSGVDDKKMIEFSTKNMDTDAISKRFCGANNEKLINTIIKFLIWRLKTEAIQSVSDYSLDKNMKTITKAKTTEVKCQLIKKGTDPVNMTITFTKDNGKLGKIREIKLLEIPLIEGAKVPMKKYFETKGIKIEQIKTPSERAEKCCEALDDFMKQNKRDAKK